MNVPHLIPDTMTDEEVVEIMVVVTTIDQEDLDQEVLIDQEDDPDHQDDPEVDPAMMIEIEEAPAMIVVPGTTEEVLLQMKNEAVLNPDPALDLAHDKNKVTFMTNYETIPTFLKIFSVVELLF